MLGWADLAEGRVRLDDVLRYARGEAVPALDDPWLDPRSLLGALVTAPPAAPAPGSLADDERAPIPPRLWTRLLGAAGVAEPEGHALHAGADEPGPPAGVARGGWEEWWGAGDPPGLGYDARLHAWGAVVAPRSPTPGPPSPRVAWSGGAAWAPHPFLGRVAAALPAAVRPPLADGPGPLHAAIVAALAAVLAAPAPGGRVLDRLRPSAQGALLALHWLPARAPSRLRPAEALGAPAEVSFTETVAFLALDPRVRAALIAVDRLCALADDPAALPPDALGAAREALRAAGRRDGLGSELVRELAALADAAPDLERFADAWATAVHGADVQVTVTGPVTALAAGRAGRFAVATPEALVVYGAPSPLKLGGARHPVTDLVWVDGARPAVWARDPAGRALRWTLGSPREPREGGAPPPVAGQLGADGRSARVEPDRVVARGPFGERELPGPATAVAWNGRRLAVGDAAGRVRVWTPGVDAPPVELEGHRGPVTALAWRAGDDARPLLTGSADGTVRAWSVGTPTGALAARLRAGLRSALAQRVDGAVLGEVVADLAWLRWSDPFRAGAR